MAVEQALAQIEADAVLYHSFVHGAAGSVVTEGGSILNMAMQAYRSDQKVLQLSIFNPRGAWVSGAVYAFRDIVTESGVNYMVLTGHTAGTFATDLAAGRLAIHQDPTAAVLQAALARDLEGEGVDFVARAKKNVATVDDLDSTPPGTHENVYVRCFETIGDGGFGEFEWIESSTTTPVRGMIHQVTGVATGRWIRQTIGNIINITWFGAIGDFNYTTYTGTDNSVAIQAAIDYINSTGEDGVLFVPGGSFMFNTSLDLTSGHVSIVGESSNFYSSVLVGNTGENFALDFTRSENRWLSIKDVSLRSFSGQTNPTSNGLLLARTSAASLHGESFSSNFRIRLASSPTANNNFGGIGVAIIGSESNDFEHFYCSADVPLWSSSVPYVTEFSAGVETTIKEITSLYQTIETSASSNTENKLSGEFISTLGDRSAIQIRNGAAWKLDVFVGRLTTPVETSTTSVPAITLGNCVSMDITGDVEGYKTAVGFYNFNYSHHIDIYKSYFATYPLVKALAAGTGATNSIYDCDIAIRPTYSTRNEAATFIQLDTYTIISGGSLYLKCGLDITGNTTSLITGTLIQNPDNKTITTNEDQSLVVASNYVEFTGSSIKKVGTITEIIQGYGNYEKKSNHYVSTLTLPSTPSRSTIDFISDSAEGYISAEVTMRFARASYQAYNRRIIHFYRSSAAVAYTVINYSDVETYDPGSILSDMTIGQTITSSIGNPLKFTLNYTLNSGAAVSYIYGNCTISNRY